MTGTHHTTEKTKNKHREAMDRAVDRLEDAVDRIGETQSLAERHAVLLDVYQASHESVERTELAIQHEDGYINPTPKERVSGGIDDVKARYEHPLLQHLAVMLVGKNLDEWLRQKPETRGAESVRRDGLTETQRGLLDALDRRLTNQR